MRRALLSLSALLLLSGCSTYVTVVTEPEGAMISDPTGSQLYGYSPVEIEYDTDLLRNQGGLVPGYRATWQSGATAQTESPFYINDLQYGATVKLPTSTWTTAGAGGPVGDGVRAGASAWAFLSDDRPGFL